MLNITGVQVYGRSVPDRRRRAAAPGSTETPDETDADRPGETSVIIDLSDEAKALLAAARPDRPAPPG